MAEYVRVAGVGEIREGQAVPFVIGTEEIALVRCEGEIYAISNICSHELSYLSDGEVDTDECVIECALHGARFDLGTGRVRALPATEPIKTFAVRVVGDDIEVAVD